LGLDISGLALVNLRHDREADRRQRYAEKLAEKRQRDGLTMPEALEKMFDRNYFGMMMVEAGDADAFLGGTYSASNAVGDIALEVVGVRPSYKHFAALHIVTTKQGTFYLSDTHVNKNMDTETLFDVARLTRNSVEYFAEKPVMAMLSYSSFGSSKEEECKRAGDVVAMLHERYPDLLVDGEMTIRYALNNELRDRTFPFNKLKGEKVNTLVFPNLSSASSAYRLLLEFGVGDTIGPIQMGLNKAVHFISVDAPVRSILNLAAIAALDAQVAAAGAPSIDK
ncbi:MAG: NADP-dependent malic enzyme, partial [Paramuribaculum sp.]|nr:NADP-dependent malic enzyme [Paramuribaculum sp.]